MTELVTAFRRHGGSCVDMCQAAMTAIKNLAASGAVRFFQGQSRDAEVCEGLLPTSTVADFLLIKQSLRRVACIFLMMCQL